MINKNEFCVYTMDALKDTLNIHIKEQKPFTDFDIIEMVRRLAILMEFAHTDDFRKMVYENRPF